MDHVSGHSFATNGTGSRITRASARSHARWQAALAVAGPFVAALLLPPVAGQVALLADPRPDVVVGAVAVLVATAVAWLLAAWSGLVCVAAVASRLPGAVGAVARRMLVSVTPAIVRRVVLAAAGVSVAAGLAACGSPVTAATSPAGTATQVIVSSAPSPGSAVAPDVTVDLDWPVAAASAKPPVTSGAASTAPTPDSTPLPPAPSAAAPAGMTPPRTAPGPSTQASRHRDGAPASSDSATTLDPDTTSGAVAEPTAMAATSGVVVRPGDSLWSIAAAQLPAGATAGRIDATWRAWYRANRDVIGPNPNLVLPGQVLQAPEPNPATSATRQEISR